MENATAGQSSWGVSFVRGFRLKWSLICLYKPVGTYSGFQEILTSGTNHCQEYITSPALCQHLEFPQGPATVTMMVSLGVTLWMHWKIWVSDGKFSEITGAGRLSGWQNMLDSIWRYNWLSLVYARSTQNRFPYNYISLNNLKCKSHHRKLMGKSTITIKSQHSAHCNASSTLGQQTANTDVKAKETDDIRFYNPCNLSHVSNTTGDHET